MKFIQSAAVIGMLLSESAQVNAVQIRNERQELVQSLSALKDDDLLNKVNQELKTPPKLAESKDDAKKTAEEMKVIEEAMGKRVLDRLGGAPQYGHNYGPYGTGDFPYVAPSASPYAVGGYGGYGYPGYPYSYPLGGYGWGEGVAALKAYHDMILGYEAQNAIAGMVHPSVDTVLKALEGATGKKEEGKKEEGKKEEGKKVEAPKAEVPKAASLIQQGLDESVVLQVNGSPVTVNPFSQEEMTPADLLELKDMQQRLSQINQKIAKDHMFMQMLPDEPYTLPNGNVATVGSDQVTGMVGNEDLGEESQVGADHVHYAHVRNQANAQKQTLPDEPYTTAGGNVATNGGDKVTGMVGNEDLGETARVGADTVHYKKKSHAVMQVQSDPIHGSLGPPPVKMDDLTPEQQFEEGQRRMPPAKYTPSEDVTTTEDSIKIAEEIVGAKMGSPTK